MMAARLFCDLAGRVQDILTALETALPGLESDAYLKSTGGPRGLNVRRQVARNLCAIEFSGEAELITRPFAVTED